ncbi:MAG TPA: SDR family oxidoreductase, partial [Candidatus Sulfotelmatobacter sp.]|nr:SDR family oxidoreductase [Candidatus Sulfotelmatobacter sp.]
LAAGAREAGVRALAVQADVTDAGQVQALVDRVAAEFGRIDILLNCAGNIRRKATLEMTPEEWDQVMDVNLRSAWLCCRAVAPVMIRQKRGCIVNMSSNAGLHGYGHGYSAYGPAKAGIHLLTKNLAIEWGRQGIRVNALVPGFTNTAFNADILANPAFANALLERIPLGGYLPPEGMVGPFLFLCSEAAAYVTGHMLHVDLGLNAR